MAQTSGGDDHEAFAQRHLRAVLGNAEASVPILHGRVQLPLSFLMLQIGATHLALLVLAGSLAALLDNVCWPAADAACQADISPGGMGWGVVGAILVRASEWWRAQGGNELALGSVAARHDEHDDHTLAGAVLVGTLPLQAMARLGVGDVSVGERSVQAVRTSPTALPKAFVHAAGVLVSTAWAQGLCQQALAARLYAGSTNAVVRLVAEDPSAVEAWWWPLAASGTAATPLIAAVITVLIAFSTERAIGQSLTPFAAAERAACEEAVSTARERSPQAFALEAPEPIARARARAFDAAAAAWQRAQRDLAWREEATMAARAMVFASVYAASGGSFVAPVLAGTLGGSQSVLDVLLRGRP